MIHQSHRHRVFHHLLYNDEFAGPGHLVVNSTQIIILACHNLNLTLIS